MANRFVTGWRAARAHLVVHVQVVAEPAIVFSFHPLLFAHDRARELASGVRARVVSFTVLARRLAERRQRQVDAMARRLFRVRTAERLKIDRERRAVAARARRLSERLKRLGQVNSLRRIRLRTAERLKINREKRAAAGEGAFV